jgi:hypothetical protein
LEYAFKVNDVALKNYDIKKDEHFIIDWDTRDDDNTEPSGPKIDPHKNDKIAVKMKVKPIEIKEKSPPRRANSRTRMNASPLRRLSSHGSNRNLMSFKNNSPEKSTDAPSPMSKRGRETVFKEPGSLIVPVDAPMNIDMSYQDRRKNNDGLNERDLDVLRITLARRNDSLEE